MNSACLRLKSVQNHIKPRHAESCPNSIMDRTVTASMPMTLRNSDADIDLVERSLAGDMTAFDELMIRYERQLYRVCYRFVENRDDAMDLAQDVFIKAFEHLASFRHESSLKTWLYRI